MESYLIVGTRFYSVALMLFVFHQKTVLGEECLPGSGSLGYTSPAGDRYIMVGGELRLNCTLNSIQSFNSSHLFWEQTISTRVNSSYVTILDEWTAELRLPNMPKGKSNFFCRAWKNGSAVGDVCRNVVWTADKPVKNVAINCTSFDLNNITCRWKLPPAIIHTDWMFDHRIGRFPNVCTHPIWNYTEGCTCLKNFSGFPTPKFVLTGKNNLGESSTKYYFKQYENVILSPPTTLNVSNITSRTAHVTWNPTSSFSTIFWIKKASIDYKITLRKSNGGKGVYYELSSPTELSFPLRHLTPFVEYSVEIQCRFVYEGYKNEWGESYRTKFKTQASAPMMAPTNLVANISSDSKEMNVTLYWTGLPREQHFGEKFWYSVSVYCNNSKYSSDETVSTYYVLSKLPSQSVCSVQLAAANEANIANEKSELLISENIMSESKLQVEDVIMQDSKPIRNMKTYNVSWTVSDSNSDNFTLYWCLGNRSDNGTVQCNDSGLHFQEEIASDQRNYAFRLPAPSSSKFSHLIGIAVDRKIIWSGCTIPTSREPRPPQYNTNITAGPTWIYVSWDPLKCEDKAVGVAGFKLYVYDSTGKETEGSPHNVSKNAVGYNVTNLASTAFYRFEIATVTSSGASSKRTHDKIQTSSWTTESPDDNDWIYAVIIGVVILGSGVLSFIGYMLYKRIRIKIAELDNIQWPSGFSQDPQVVLATTESSRYIDDNMLGNYKLPLLHIQPTITKEQQQKSRGGSDSSGFGADTDINDDLSSLSSPTGSYVSSYASSQDSGLPLETPKCDAINSFYYGNNMDVQETPTTTHNGYSRAVILDPVYLPHLPNQGSNTEYPNPIVYSRVGSYVCPAESVLLDNVTEASHNREQVPSYARVVGFTTPVASHRKMYPSPQQSPSDVHSAGRTVGQNGNTQVAAHCKTICTPDLDKSGGNYRAQPKPRLNSLDGNGYAQISVVMEQVPISRRLSQSLDKIGYVKVTTAVDGPKPSQCSPTVRLSESIPGCGGYHTLPVDKHQPMVTQLLSNDTSRVSCCGNGNGYAPVNLAMEQTPISGRSNSLDNVGYMPVTSAVDEPKPIPSFPDVHLSNPIVRCSGAHHVHTDQQKPQLLVPNDNTHVGGYKCINESNLVSPNCPQNNSPSCYRHENNMMLNTADGRRKTSDSHAAQLLVPDAAPVVSGYKLINESNLVFPNLPQNNSPSGYRHENNTMPNTADGLRKTSDSYAAQPLVPDTAPVVSGYKLINESNLVSPNLPQNISPSYHRCENTTLPNAADERTKTSDSHAAQLLVPDATPITSGYKHVNESNLVTPNLPQNNSLSHYEPFSSNVLPNSLDGLEKSLDSPAEQSVDIPTSSSCTPLNGGYVTAPDLISNDVRTYSSDQLCQNPSQSLYKRHYAPVLL